LHYLLLVISFALPVMYLHFYCIHTIHAGLHEIILWGIQSNAIGPFIGLLVMSFIFIFVAGMTVYRLATNALMQKSHALYAGTLVDKKINSLHFNNAYVLVTDSNRIVKKGEIAVQPTYSFSEVLEPAKVVVVGDEVRHAGYIKIGGTAGLHFFTPLFLFFFLVSFAIAFKPFVVGNNIEAVLEVAKQATSNNIQPVFLYSIKSAFTVLGAHQIASIIVFCLIAFLVYKPKLFHEPTDNTAPFFTLTSNFTSGKRLTGTLIELGYYAEKRSAGLPSTRSKGEEYGRNVRIYIGIVEFEQGLIFPVQIAFRSTKEKNEHIAQTLNIGDNISGTLNKKLEFIPD